MGKLKSYFFGFLTASCLVACGSMPVFPYKFFHLTGNNFSGQLLGPNPKDDVPFSKCIPVVDGNGKQVQQCVVVFYTELNALIDDYKKTKSDLIACQKKPSYK